MNFQALLLKRSHKGSVQTHHNFKQHYTTDSTNMSMQIFIRILTGRTITLDVDSDDTIERVKQMLCDRQHCGHVDSIRLIYAGRSLEDFRTLGDYNIQNEATIFLITRYLRRAEPPPTPLRVFIKRASGKTVTLDLTSSDTVRYVKMKVLDAMSIPFDAQEIGLDCGSKASDDQTLSSLNVANNSFLYVLIKRPERRPA